MLIWNRFATLILIGILTATLAACSARKDTAMNNQNKTIIDFKSPDSVQWFVINDGVMGAGKIAAGFFPIFKAGYQFDPCRKVVFRVAEIKAKALAVGTNGCRWRCAACHPRNQGRSRKYSKAG